MKRDIALLISLGCKEPLLVKFAERGTKKKTMPAALTPERFTPERDDASLTVSLLFSVI